ncbi:hypothetical protein BLNAU_24621 [Blattamonas nauphoetae]|uniref:Uncharacterized protein n=1 Tax=Blattamonas nauphoetae TaxID=2049346 RepID=A0ABQ9WPR8_9EUKA|nr:hypothetical protein BLNAU_24621 [Blattamonas nauphoetae]
MGNNISRHIQSDKPERPLNLGNDDLSILRRIQGIIDSCVGVLKQPDFLDFDNQLTNEELSDLSHLLYQSFPTEKAEHNDRYSLKQYLFRSSIFSLFGHLILNSQTFINYTKNINTEVIYKILHVITGTPGMGKSASRFPFITLLMSFGVESVTTKKDGERVYVFKRKNKVRTGTTTISMDVSSGTPLNFDTPSYLYTFDVYSFEEPERTDVYAEKIEKVKEKVYIPNALKLPGPNKSKPGWTLLGSVSVPSVEHFPYFLRLLVGHQSDTLTATNPPNVDNQICQGSPLVVVNRLENTKWHVVDEITISVRSKLLRDTNYVLFTSPKGSRWKQLGADEKMCRCLTLEYVVPKYTPQEQAALLNTMGTRGITPDELHQIHQGLEHFSFIPRHVLQKETPIAAVYAVYKSGKDIGSIEPGDLFTDKYDCHNWHTEFATELARWITLDTFNTTMQEKYIETLKSLSDNAEFNQHREAAFHAFVSDAILGGFCQRSARKLLSDEMLDDIQLPPPLGESFVHMRYSGSMWKASLPDIKTIPVEKLSDFDEKWAFLFSSPMHPCFISSTTLLNRDDSDAKCFTFCAKPLGGNDVGFSSVLLFFKVHEEQGELKIDDICVMFIKSTLANYTFASVITSDLMFLFLTLLCRVYGLSEQHIHPFVFFVKQPATNFFLLKREYPADSFIPRDNVWVMDAHARDLKEAILTHPGRLILSAATALPPNTNPTHFRCFFCDRIITEFFPDHHCEAIPEKYEEALTVRSIQGATRHILEFNLISTQPANLGIGRDERRRYVERIELDCPCPNKLIPKSNRKMTAFHKMDVVMVGVGGEPESLLSECHIADEPEQTKLRFEVSQTHPIPNIFTYFTRRPNAPRPPQSATSLIPAVAFRGTKTRLILLNEFSDPTSRLPTSARMIDLWANQQRIGFGGQMGDDVLSMGAQHPPHDNFGALLENKEVPLACIHLPMSIFPKQTLLLGTRQILTPFEIRGILSLVDQKDPKECLKKIDEHINLGQPLTPDDANLILSTPSVFSLLVASDLNSLKTRIPTLSSLSLYDLQVLVAYVSGTLTLISDILGRCRSYLSHPKKLNGTDAQKLELKQMEMCLKNSLTVASDRLMEVLQYKVLGKRRDLSDDDVELVMKGMKTNPLLPWWCRHHVIPFMTEVPPNQQKQTELLAQLKTTFKRTEREVWSTILLIHAPIEESEKTHLTILVDSCLQLEPAQKQTLKSLVEKHVFSQDDVDSWNAALTCLEMKQKDKMSTLAFLDRLIPMVNEVSEEDSRILENAILSAENLLDRDRDTLLSLVNRKPRFPSSRRQDMISFCCPNITPESEGQCVTLIEGSELDSKEKEILKDFVTNHKPTNDEEMAKLKQLINKDEALRRDANHLFSFFRHSNAIVAPDRSLALLYCQTQIELTEFDHDSLFRCLNGEDLDETYKETIEMTIDEFRVRLRKKQKHLFTNLKETSLSWKDLAALLCLPNGGYSTPLPGLDELVPTTSQERKRRNSTFSQLSYWSRKEMEEQFLGEPSTYVPGMLSQMPSKNRDLDLSFDTDENLEEDDQPLNAKAKKGDPRQSTEEDACILSLLETLSNFGVPSTRIVFAGHVDHFGGELVTTGKRGKSVFVDVGGVALSPSPAPMSVEEIALMSYSESAGGRVREWLLKTHTKFNQLFGQLFDVLFADVLHPLPTPMKLDVQSPTEEKMEIDEDETEWNNVSTDEPSPAQSNPRDQSALRWPEDQLWCLEDCNLSPIGQQPTDVHISVLFLRNRCDAIDTQLRRIEAALQKMNDEGSSDHSQKEEAQTHHALETMDTEESDKTEHAMSLREIVSRGWNRLTETRETRQIFDEDTLLNWRKMRHLTTPDDLDERGHMTEAADTPEESAIPSDLCASPPKRTFQLLPSTTN